MQKRVLFLGGAYAQMPIIQEAKNRGWYVITCDYLPDNPGHKLADEYHNESTTDFESILQVAQQVKPDFIIAYASDPAAPVASFVSEQLALPGNSYESVKVLSEKDLFRNFLKSHGFNTPQTVTINENKFDTEELEKLHFPVIVKPTDSSGSKGVVKVDNSSAIEQAFKYALGFSRNKRIIVEEFVESAGSQLHGDGFVYDGELVFSYLGDHHYDSEINPFVPYSTTWPSVKPELEIKAVESEVSKAIKLLGFKMGAVNIEARITDKGDIYIMEIGPRSGGNFVPQAIQYATGFDMVKATLDAINGEKVCLDFNSKRPAAYYVLHSNTTGLLRSITINEQLKSHIKEFHQYIQVGQNVNSFQGANAAIGILLLTFSSVGEMNDYIENMDQWVEIQVDNKKQ